MLMSSKERKANKIPLEHEGYFIAKYRLLSVELYELVDRLFGD